MALGAPARRGGTGGTRRGLRGEVPSRPCRPGRCARPRSARMKPPGGGRPPSGIMEALDHLSPPRTPPRLITGDALACSPGVLEPTSPTSASRTRPRTSSCWASDRPGVAAVFTRSRFAGPSVVLSRAHAGRRPALQPSWWCPRTPTSPPAQGRPAPRRGLVAASRRAAGCAADDVLVASTGVIGRPYPMDGCVTGLDGALAWVRADRAGRPRAIMTTDTVPKVAARRRRRRRARRRHRQGRRHDRARHGHDDRLLLTDAERRRPTRCGALPAGDRPHVQLPDASTPTRPPATPPPSWPAAPPARSTPTLRGGAADVALSLTKQIARDGEGATS